MTANADHLQKLLDMANEKNRFLLEILDITKKQGQTINEDGISDLERLVNDKKKIDEVKRLDQELSEYIEHASGKIKIKNICRLDSSYAKFQNELKEYFTKEIELIGSICEMDDQNCSRAKSLLNELGTELKKIRNGKKINQFYNQNPELIPMSYFMDKKK